MARHSPAASLRRDIFPPLGEHDDFPFPDVEQATGEGILCQGGNLSPGMLLSAYRRGIFPWYGPGEPLLWWSPDPRFALIPRDLHVSATSRKLLRRLFGDPEVEVSLDGDFASVIRACATARRRGQRGTWIVQEMIDAYTDLHRLGYAHSVELRRGGKLAGGLYGVSLGRAFFGESMFSIESGASRAAFLCLALRLTDEGYSLIDSQVYTDYLAEMGARDMPRASYLSLLAGALGSPTLQGPWSDAFPGFPTSAGLSAILARSTQSTRSNGPR